MRRHPAYKSGHLDVKLPVKMRGRGFRGWKAWKRRWIVLHRLQDIAAGNAVITLDLYHNATGERQHYQLERATIYLESAMHLQRVTSRSHPYAFYIEARDNAVYLAADCESDTQDWMNAICEVFWPRPHLCDDTTNIYSAAVTDSAFCTLFGVHGGFCYIRLTSTNLLLHCMYTKHVLLEWPIAALARVYVDITASVKDRGRLFVIEPRPQTSGWTTPLNFFSVKAQEIVECISARMHGRGTPTLSSPPTAVTEKAFGGRRCTSFYDHPLSSKGKQTRRISEISHYDTPRGESASNENIDMELKPRKRSHSESFLAQALHFSSDSLNQNPGSLSALDQEDVPNLENPIPPNDDYAKLKLATEIPQDCNEYPTLQSEKEKRPSEPLYEELDRLHKDINKLLGIDRDEIQPPPLPPRSPVVVYPKNSDKQKKDVVRFLGMDDPWARRMIHSQQTTALQMTQGVRKKNLFHFLGVDGVNSSLAPPAFYTEKRPEIQQYQQIVSYENEILDSINQVQEQSDVNQVEYDVPLPLSFVYNSCELFAVKLLHETWNDVWLGLEEEISKRRIINDIQTTIIKNDKAIEHVQKKLFFKRNVLMKKIFGLQLKSSKIFFSVLYYSWFLDLCRIFNRNRLSGDEVRRIALSAQGWGWCKQVDSY